MEETEDRIINTISMTIMVLCLKIVSKNNYQIGVKAVSAGGRKFCNPIQNSCSCCAKSLSVQALNEVMIKLISLFTLSQALSNHS